MESNLCIIILAAGSSKRLGYPKQLVQIQGQYLLDRSIELALSLSPKRIVTVISPAVKPFFNHESISVCSHSFLGVGYSISFGVLEAIKNKQKYSGILLLTCDQWRVDFNALNRLKDSFFKNSKKIVASSYNSTLGIPVIFPIEYADELLKLRGDKGAKKLLEKFKSHLIEVSMPMAAFDLDDKKDMDFMMVNSIG